jgi:hypothetical protein
VGKLGDSKVFDLHTKKSMKFILGYSEKILAPLGKRSTWVSSEMAAAKGWILNSLIKPSASKS